MKLSDTYLGELCRIEFSTIWAIIVLSKSAPGIQKKFFFDLGSQGATFLKFHVKFGQKNFGTGGTPSTLEGSRWRTAVPTNFSTMLSYRLFFSLSDVIYVDGWRQPRTGKICQTRKFLDLKKFWDGGRGRLRWELALANCGAHATFVGTLRIFLFLYFE